MAVEFAAGGIRAGLERPLALVALPVVVAALGWLLLRARERTTFDRRQRALVFAARFVVVALLVGAAAGPFTVAEKEVSDDPTVTMLVDRSDSMEAVTNVTGDVATGIEDEGVRVETRVVGSDSRSAVGDGVASSLTANGSVLVVSDGRVTTGRSLGEAAALAQGVNATINAVALSADTTERAVTIQGPSKTSVGVENTFLVGVSGVELGDTSAPVTVSVDGEEVASGEVSGSGAIEVSRAFDETGSHRLTARIESDDVYDRNDVFRKTVRVVEPPRVLYVARGTYPLADYLDRLYDVERAERVPADLSPYYAVVLQDVAADDVGEVDALQRAVINGTGLVTVGGPNSFEFGDYGGSQLEGMLPVSIGEGGRTSRIVLAIDISGSTTESLSVQQALALDVIQQLGDENRIGIVAFNRNAYAISDLQLLGGSRANVARTIRRLESEGGTDISAGIEGATQMLGNSDGTIILLSDGQAQVGNAPGAAAAAADRNVRVISIGVGRDVNAPYLRNVAQAGDGTYLRADETNKLRIFFGGENRQYAGGGLTVVDSDHFITTGVTFESSPARANAVATEDRADFLVAGPTGNPVVAAWRYGLGRSVTITAHDEAGTLDGLLSPPDSLAVTKSVNWAIGDPERLATGVTDVSDARVGSPVEVTYEGSSRPSVDGLRFTKVGTRTYRATIVPSEPGYGSVLDAAYAVNYPAEYASFGPSSALRGAVAATGGQVYEPNQAETIAEQVRREARQIETVREEWAWLLLLAALLGYLTEVSARRYYRIKAS